MVEYSLILALAAIVCISSLKLLGSSIHDQITGLSDSITRASTVTVAAANNPVVPASGGGSQPATGATDTSDSGQTLSDLSAVESDNSGGASANGSGDTSSVGDNPIPTDALTGTVPAVSEPVGPDPELEQNPTDAAVPSVDQAAIGDCVPTGFNSMCGANINAGFDWGF